MSQKLLIFVTYYFIPLYYENIKTPFSKIDACVDIAIASISPCYGNFIL